MDKVNMNEAFNRAMTKCSKYFIENPEEKKVWLVFNFSRRKFLLRSFPAVRLVPKPGEYWLCIEYDLDSDTLEDYKTGLNEVAMKYI